MTQEIELLKEQHAAEIKAIMGKLSRTSERLATLRAAALNMSFDLLERVDEMDAEDDRELEQAAQSVTVSVHPGVALGNRDDIAAAVAEGR